MVATLHTVELSRKPRSNPVAHAWAWWRKKATVAVNISIIVLFLLILAVILAPPFLPFEPSDMNLRNRLQPPVLISVEGTWTYPLGTDATGRDLLTRVLYGGQISLVIGGIATTAGLILGVLLGMISGLVRGWVDYIVMYLVDVQLSLPFILLAVAVSLVLGKSLIVLTSLAALATWPIYARVVRGVVLSLRERDFVVAARASGGGSWHIMATHLLPNLAAPVLVLATLSVGRIILLESGLSFLGIGVQPPTPSWGNMINDGREYLSTAWWVATVPGIALVLLTMAVGTIGDWLRDTLDVTIS